VSVAQYLRQTFPGAHFTDQQVLTFLDSLVANKLMVTADRYYLSLAIRAQPVRTVSDGESKLGAAHG
jgi:hypothetical protein